MKLLSLYKVASLEEASDAILWDMDRFSAAIFAGTYVTALTTAVFGESLRHTNIPLDLIEEMDGISHSAAAAVLAGPLQVIELPRRLVATIFEQWVRTYDKRNLYQSHKIGPFSSIRLAELAPLANRDARMSKKYGTKQIEKVFEQQLALIVQSFSLYVRTGQRTVDLICISADPTARFTFLLEAKRLRVRMHFLVTMPEPF